jgi:hypothetical protein
METQEEIYTLLEEVFGSKKSLTFE